MSIKSGTYVNVYGDTLKVHLQSEHQLLASLERSNGEISPTFVLDKNELLENTWIPIYVWKAQKRFKQELKELLED